MSTVSCKQCTKSFDNTPIKAWGQMITPVRCGDCRRVNTQAALKQQEYDRNFGKRLEEERIAHSKRCDGENNAGGYCIKCGFGRDFS
jgi:hypothetical protein